MDHSPEIAPTERLLEEGLTIRLIEHHGVIAQDADTKEWETHGEHWVVNGKKFYRKPTDAEIDAAYACPQREAEGVAYRGLCEIREIYCNMEGFDAKTAPEGYLQQEIKKMYDTAVEHIKIIDGETK